MILCSDEIDLDCLPEKVRQAVSPATNFDENGRTLEEIERRYVMDVLIGVGDDKVEAANILGIDLSTLYRKLKRYELLSG